MFPCCLFPTCPQTDTAELLLVHFVRPQLADRITLVRGSRGWSQVIWKCSSRETSSVVPCTFDRCAWTPRYARHTTARAPERKIYSQLSKRGVTLVLVCFCGWSVLVLASQENFVPHLDALSEFLTTSYSSLHWLMHFIASSRSHVAYFSHRRR